MYDFEYDTQDATIFTLVMQTRDAISQLSKKALSKVSITPEKYHVLLLCVHSDEPVTINALSRMLFRKPHSVLGLLNRMEAEGLIVREKPGTQDDQGPMCIKLTDQGLELYRQSMQLMVSSVTSCMERVPKGELDHLEKGLRSLRNSILREMNIESYSMNIQLRQGSGVTAPREQT